MPGNSEVRDVVRQLMWRFDSMDARYTSFLHVVAKKDPEEYTRLLDTSERITPKVPRFLLSAIPCIAKYTSRWMTRMQTGARRSSHGSIRRDQLF